MKRFNFAYAHDISCYAEFSVEADTPEQAKEYAEEQLKQNAFINVPTEVDWNSFNMESQRVFLMDAPHWGDFDDIATLENIEIYKPESPASSSDGAEPAPTNQTPTPHEIR